MSDQHLVITSYSIHSDITIDAPGPDLQYISYNTLIMEGLPAAPYTMNAVQIKFVPDGQPLMQPSWQDPNLSCEKHQGEYAAILDMINKGIDNKKAGTSFTADYYDAVHKVVLMLTF